MSEPTYAIKCRKNGDTRWVFFTGSGISHLRIRATRYTQSEAERIAQLMREDNPNYEFTTRRFDK